MKTIQLLLLALVVTPLPARADIEIRLSVKFILNWDGTRPANAGSIDLSTTAAFDAEIAHGNRVLAATGRGYRLRVVEYLDVQPSAPAGQPLDYWFNLSARSNRWTFEMASVLDPVVWKRNNSGALNLYVNNTSSGQCSFVGSGDTITLGATLFNRGTVIHEIGHFFNLSHTHGGNPSCIGFMPPTPLSSGLGDDDGLSETIPDHPCYNRDQLSMANFGDNYAAISLARQAAVDTVLINVMSYHQEDQLLDIQMDYWTDSCNRTRHSVCSGYTWFLATNGSDGNDGLSPGQSFASVDHGLAHVSSADDVVLLKTGFYAAPANIVTPCTLRTTRGSVTLTR